jgi:hypothetical protein
MEKLGSISSTENDDDDVRDDCKLPALPLAMKRDDPILDTYNAWQRETIASVLLPLPPVKNSAAFSQRHSPSFEDLNKNSTTTSTNGDSPDFGKNHIPSPVEKMPYDDLLRAGDATEEGCVVDGKGLPTTSSSFPPSVALPNLDDRQHGHVSSTSTCVLKMSHINHLFRQNTNNYRGDIGFDRGTIKETLPSAYITTATSLSPYHGNSTSANANYDSPRPMAECHPAIITSSTPLPPKSMGDNPSPLSSESRFQSGLTWTAAENHIFSPSNQFQRHTEDSSSATVESSEDSGGRSKKKKGAWQENFERLKKYKNEHNGSCDVPQKVSLGAWVNKVSRFFPCSLGVTLTQHCRLQQRMEYKVLIDGTRRSSMTDERRRLLESIGFKWAEQKGQASWERRFNELVAYKNMVSISTLTSLEIEREFH